jgi:hypothetical protein
MSLEEQDGQPDPEPVLPGHIPTPNNGLSAAVQDPSAATQDSNSLQDHNVGKVVVDIGQDGLQVDESSFIPSPRAGDECAGTAAADV